MAFQISKDELESLYCNNGLSSNKIAEMFNTSSSTILTKMKLYEIPRRDQSECKIGSNNPNYNNGDKLKEAWSRGCYSNRDIGGYKNPNYQNKLKMMNCDFCGEQFTRYPSQHPGNNTFCSQSCSSKYYQSHRNGELQIGMNGYQHTEITKKILSEVRIGKYAGENASNWQGGISFEPYCTKFNNSFKESIRKQFNYICFICGISQDEQMDRQRFNGKQAYKLSVHHVNYDKSCLCDDIKCKFVPLCTSCHSKTNGNRDDWENMIIDKLRVN